MIDIVTKEHGNVITIEIDGEFYLESIEYAEQVWNKQVAKSPSTIGISCNGIKYIDSSAIGVLVKFLNNAMRHKINLIFYDLSDTVVSVFKITKLDKFFNTMSKNQFEIEYLIK